MSDEKKQVTKKNIAATFWEEFSKSNITVIILAILTGVILATARGAGEVAPLMITGVVKLAPDLTLPQCEDIAALALEHFAQPLAGRPVYLAIGSRDNRVGTECCIRLALRISEEESRLAKPFGQQEATRGGLDVLLCDLRGQVRDALDAAGALELAVGEKGHAARIVTAILETLEPFDEDRDDVARRDGADDSAHGCTLRGSGAIAIRNS